MTKLNVKMCHSERVKDALWNPETLFTELCPEYLGHTFSYRAIGIN
jgi:hypothetical protein